MLVLCGVVTTTVQQLLIRASFNPHSRCRIARYKPHAVVDSRLVANTLSRLKNLVSRVRWKSVEPMVVIS